LSAPVFASKIVRHIRPFTTPGIAHGSSTRLRSTPRPRNVSFSTSARAVPSTTVRTSTTTTNATVTRSELRNVGSLMSET
jgi:hypothetical protein